MKKLYTYLGMLALFLVFTTANSQVLIVEDFDTAIPADWNAFGFQQTTNNPCDVGSARRNFLDGQESGSLRSPFDVATGEDIEINFDYKIIDQGTGNATSVANDFGNIQIQYTIDNGSNWITEETIDNTNHVESASCATYSLTLNAADVPNGSDFAVRFLGTWNDPDGSGPLSPDYYVYLDNVEIIEQVDCIQPTDITVSGITFNSFDVDWTEIASATEWEVSYGVPGAPAGGVGTNTITTTTHPVTITNNVSDGTDYDVYVRSICGPNDNSVWVGPIQIQTVAVGSDCANAIEIQNLDYTDTDDTSTFGNNYSGVPGSGCASTGNYLNGNDVVYHYLPPTDDILQIELSNVSQAFTGVFVYESCSDIGSICVEGSTNDVQGNHAIEDLFVTAGQDYYIVISSFPSGGMGQTFSYTLDVKGFDCANFEEPDGDMNQDYIDGQTLNDLDVDVTIDGANLTWYSDAAATNTISDTTLLVDGQTYYVTQTIGNCESAILAITVSEFDCTSQLSITSTDNGDGVCDSGTVDLSATANTDNIYWYENQSGGEVVNVGTDFTTPVLTETTSYWVAEAFLGEGTTFNAANPGPTSILTSTTNGGLEFTASNNFTIQTVQVYMTAAAGALEIELLENGSQVELITVATPAGTASNPTPLTIDLDFDITSGNTYRIRKVSGPSMVYSSGGNYPYPIGVSGEVTSGATATSTSTNYYYFYNWTITEFQALCESTRQEVVATVYDIIPVAVQAADNSVCLGSSTSLTATSTNSNYNYTWMPGSLTGASVNVSPDVETTYTVTAVDNVTGCQTSANITVGVIGLPDDLEVNPNPANVCIGESLKLFAGGIGYSFEGGGTPWNTVNNSSDASAAWEIVSSPETIDGTNISSNDNSQFYISNSALSGTGSNLETVLTSPTFSLVGTTNANLEFYHFYAHHPTTTANVEISTNGGSNWNNLQTYNSTQGLADNFAFVSLDLNAYVGEENLKVRFSYEGAWGFWWAIDNVLITREFENSQVTWSSNSNLYLDASGNNPYNGLHAPKVFYKSDTEEQVTVTATIEIGDCITETQDVTINVSETLAPQVGDEYYFEEGETLEDVDVVGDNIQWYMENADGDLEIINDLSEIDLVHQDTYYVTQTQNNCESELVEVTVLFNCPVPTELTVVETTGSTATLMWAEEDEIDKIENYYLEVTRVSDGEIVFTGIIYPTFNTITVNDLEPNTEYTYIVYSICNADKGILGNTAGPESFETDDELGVGNSDLATLSYYPNPTSGQITVQNSLPINNILVYDLLGKEVLHYSGASSSTVKLDLSSLASGTYLAKVVVGDSMKMVKIIKE